LGLFGALLLASSCAQVAGLGDLERVDCLDNCDGGDDVTTTDGGGGMDVRVFDAQPDMAAMDVVMEAEAGCPMMCSGTTPVCDLSISMCVECLMDSDCPNGKVCSGKQCKPGCASDHTVCNSVDGGQLRCDLDSGVCRQCITDNDCGGALPRCDTETYTCVPCLPTNDNCPVGKRCLKQGPGTYTCAAGCRTIADCFPDGGVPEAGAGTIACCNNTCIDTSLDVNHCGSCGNTCGADGGTANACCNSVCKDTRTDPDHCGACNAVACSGNHVTSRTCSAGQCTSACASGYADCDSDLRTNGCEVNIANGDPDHCGACVGKSCSGNNVTRTCTGGMCVGACASGFSDCNGDKLTDGCEVDTNTDPNHCGGCIGHVCSNNNVTPQCTGGNCNGACANGWSDCDNNKLSNGCEVLTGGSDVLNCGGCNVVCSTNNITRACTSGVCNGACIAGAADCDNNKQTDGCEVLTSTDPNNCGMCGTSCSGNNVTRSCGGSVCNGACSPGFADCDLNLQTDGCETSTTTTTNCGGCGNACNTTVSNNTGRNCSGGTTCTYTCAGTRKDCNFGTAPNLDGCECALPSCGGNGCVGSTSCSTIQHADGLGQNYYDCTALNTFNGSQALEACTAYAIAQGKTVSNCSDGWTCTSLPSVTSVCYSNVAGSNSCDTDCWQENGGHGGWVVTCADCTTRIGTWN
jgi:Cys-rich repeat protein